MPDAPTNPEGTNNPRNAARAHKKPTRRSASAPVRGAVPGATGAQRPVNPGATGAQRAVGPSTTGAYPASPSATGAQRSVPAYPNGHDAVSQEAAARAAYEQYVANTNTPYPGAASNPQYGSRYQQQGGYAGYAQSSAPRVMPAAPSELPGSPYADAGRYKKKGKKKAGIVSVLAALVILGAIGVGVYLHFNPLSFNVTVNGMTRTVDRGTTLSDIIEEGVVTPVPGNLVAVDGEVIEEGGGTAFVGTVNGDEVDDPAFELHSGDTVQLDHGADVTEEYDVETVETQPEQVELGEGALHVYVPGEASQVEKRTGKVSGKTVEETVTEGVDNVYLKYNADTDGDKVIALTFDDGPWAGSTEQILKILKENDAKATFFTISEQISDKTDFSALVKQAADAGHQIATHSYDHAATGGGNGVDMTRQSPEKQIEEVQMGQQAITDATGTEASKAFRSPGGNYHGDIIWNLAPYVTSEIGWNIDTEDWRRPGVDAIVQRLLSVKSGDVVLMHDGGGDRSQTVEALSIALPQLKAQGYKFVTIDELLAYDDAKALAQELQAASAE